MPSTVISSIALFAIINGVLIQLIMASRVLYGLANQASLPATPAYVHPRTRTPLLATALVTAFIIPLALLKDFQFLPGGRILAGAGSDHEVTLFNCFVMGHIDDDMESIFNALKEGALTMQQGGGVGYDFSSLRPAGSRTARVGGSASGPVSSMRIWNTMCGTLLSTSNRRGAMMGTLRCDHPDIETFVEAKRQPGELQNFNLSVLVTDAFMQAIEADDAWPLVFPTKALQNYKLPNSAI